MFDVFSSWRMTDNRKSDTSGYSHIGIIITDYDDTVLWACKRIGPIFGRERSEIIGSNLQRITSHDTNNPASGYVPESSGDESHDVSLQDVTITNCYVTDSTGRKRQLIRTVYHCSKGPFSGKRFEIFHVDGGLAAKKDSVELPLFNQDPDTNINSIVQLFRHLIGASCADYFNRASGQSYFSGESDDNDCLNYLFGKNGCMIDQMTKSDDNFAVVTGNDKTPAVFPHIFSGESMSTVIGKGVKDDAKIIGCLCALFHTVFTPDRFDMWLINTMSSALAVEEKRKKAASFLSLRERENISILDSVSDLVMHLDNEMNVVWINKAGSIMCKKSLQTLIGNHCFSALYDRSDPCPSCPAVLAYKKSIPVEKELKTPDGKYWHLKAYPIIDDNGNVEGIVEIGRDMSERKMLESKFMQAQKMEVIGRFAGGIAHDFNNILSVIIGFADLFLLSHSDVDTSDIYEIKKIAQRAGKLTHQLLTFSRQQILEPQIVIPNELLFNMNKMLRRLIGVNIEFNTIVDDGLWPIRVDLGQFEQVVTNLVVNACDAMPSGGKITITTQNTDSESALETHHDDLPDGEYVLVRVSDTGTGMDEETLSKAFEPFYTTKSFGKGTGLGLSTCYGIVKQSGGEIILSSKVGEGTDVRIYFPRIMQDISQTSMMSFTNNAVGGTETILIVEDDQLLNEMLSRILTKRGYRVIQAMHGEEALRIMHDDNRNDVQLVITDLVMPQMGGIELVAKIRQMRNTMKVLYISGYADDSLADSRRALSNEQFLQKPFAADMLSYKVREILDNHCA